MESINPILRCHEVSISRNGAENAKLTTPSSPFFASARFCMKTVLRPHRDFNEVKAELGLHGTVDFADFLVEYHAVKFRDHLSR